MKRLLRLVGPLIVILVFLAAVWLLYHELRNYRLAEIGARIWDISPLSLALALAFTVVNYLILVGYDWVAVRFIGQKQSLRHIALAAFTGYACSYNFGATLAGTTIRLRLYSAWGMPPVKILELLVILGLTFWFGLFGLAGAVFIVDPPKIIHSHQVARAHHDVSRKGPPAQHSSPAAEGNNGTANASAPDTDETRRIKRKEVRERILYFAADLRFWGIVLLLTGLAYVGLSATSLTHIKIFGHELPVPPFKLTVYQFVIVAADMLVAGIVLYCLMHHIPGIGTYAELLGIYILVYVAVVLSHVPGGYGVFEAGMIFCLRQAATVPAEVFPADQILAALFVFRVIYFWGPLLLAIILLGINEVILRRRARLEEEGTPASLPE